MKRNSAKKRIEDAEKRLRKQVKKNSWPISFIDDFEPLKLSQYAHGGPYDMVYPGFIDPKDPDNVDVLEICGDKFLPFGSCSNGDLVVVVVVEIDGFKVGQVCLLSLSLFNESHAPSYYLRFVSENLKQFFERISDGIFPTSCFDESEVSPRLKAKLRKKKKATKKKSNE